jgi:hypothetical protein
MFWSLIFSVQRQSGQESHQPTRDGRDDPGSADASAIRGYAHDEDFMAEAG